MRFVHYLIVITTIICLFISMTFAGACDEFERDYILKKLFVRQMQGKNIEDFEAIAHKCGIAFRGGAAKGDRPSKAIKGINRFDLMILEASERYGIDPALIKAVIHAESNFQKDAVSPKGAIGLAQVMPSTAESLGVTHESLWYPAVNVDTGARYLALNLARFDSLKKALIAYNAGPSVARKIDRIEDVGVIPGETKVYLRRVIHLYNRYKSSSFGKK